MAQHDDDDDAFEVDDDDDGGERGGFTQSRPWRWVLIAGSVLFLLALTLPIALQACEAGRSPEPTPPTPTPSAGGSPVLFSLDFELPAAGGSTVRLKDAARGYDYVAVVFYRGFF